MNLRLNHTIAQLIAPTFIFLFLYTAISKLAGMTTFQSVLSHSPLIGINANFIAWLIPILEIAITVWLCIPKFRSGGLLASALLMAIFTTYIAAMLLTASRLPCSCGGILKHLSWPEHLIVNILLTIIAFIGYRVERKNKIVVAITRSSRIPV